MALSAEQLKQQLEEEKENSKRMEEDVEILRLQNEMEMEKMKQEQWKVAYGKLKEAREQAAQEHQECLKNMEALASAKKHSSPATLDWLRNQIGSLSLDTGQTPAEPEDLEHTKQEAAKATAIRDLKAQQELINQAASRTRGLREPPHHKAQMTQYSSSGAPWACWTMRKPCKTPRYNSSGLPYQARRMKIPQGPCLRPSLLLRTR